MTPITAVRVRGEEARRQLREFVFSAGFTFPRAPRGIAPEEVADFVRSELQPSAGWRAYERALDLMRFYETRDAVEHVMRAIARDPADLDALLRSVFAIEIVADLGSPDQAQGAAQRFDEIVERSALPKEALPVLIETLEVLAPAGKPDALVRRMDREIDKARQSGRGSAGAQMYDQLASLRENDLRRALSIVAVKTRLTGTTVDARREELAGIYLGLSPYSDPFLTIWAGRRLRDDARRSHAAAVRQVLSETALRPPARPVDDNTVRLARLRAAQGVVYLGGSLPPDSVLAAELHSQEKTFLWDDPTPAGRGR